MLLVVESADRMFAVDSVHAIMAITLDAFIVYTSVIFFFFSSRRRHTRCSRDWSSDVCSSDLQTPIVLQAEERPVPLRRMIAIERKPDRLQDRIDPDDAEQREHRSEREHDPEQIGRASCRERV